MQLSYAFLLFVASFASSSTGAIPSIHVSAQKCVDSPFSFPSGRGRTATCEDIGGSKVKAKVCKKKEKFASHCPKTCNKCEEYKCKDSTKGFFIREGVKKKCKWLNKKSDDEKEQECMKKSVESTCRDTCGYCVLSSAPPTANPTTTAPPTASPTTNPTTATPTVKHTTTDPTMNPTTVSPTVNPTTASPTAKSAAPSVFPTSNPTVEEQCRTDQLDIIQTGNSIEAKATADFFGRSVLISENGKTLAIGAPGGNGLVQIYSLNSQNEWTQMVTDFEGSNTDDFFGQSVSLSTTGNRLAVSSKHYARIFDFDVKEGKWIKIGPDIVDESEVGLVALSGEGDTLAVSMPSDDNGSGNNAGKVQVFSLKNKEWTKEGNNEAMTGSNSRDYLGSSGLAISTDGTTVAVGSGSWSGNYVKVFRLVGDVWSLLGGVINGESGEWFGISVDLSHDGGRVVIGAEGNSFEGKTSRGRAVVYDFIHDNWVTVGESLYGENSGDTFGGSVSISDSGKRLAVGGRSNNANGENAGHVRVFEYDDNEDSNKWSLIEEAIDGESEGDYSGWSVALSNDANFVAIGAPANPYFGDKTGSVRVFEMKCESE